MPAVAEPPRSHSGPRSAGAAGGHPRAADVDGHARAVPAVIAAAASAAVAVAVLRRRAHH
jgi:hypothetical protein